MNSIDQDIIVHSGTAVLSDSTWSLSRCLQPVCSQMQMDPVAVSLNPSAAATAVDAAPPSVFDKVSMPHQYIGIKLAPYNPTHVEAVEIALDLLQLAEGDKVYDLGCGDARFLVQAHRRCVGVVGVGVEYDATVVGKARANIDSLDAGHSITLVHGNALDVDFSDATALFVYLVPEGMKKLADGLHAAVQRGARVVTYVFSVPGLEPVQTVLFKNATKIYLYKV